MKEWALKYLTEGYSVIPVGQDKKPLIKWEPYQKKLPDKTEVIGWWDKNPNANIAVVTGEISGVVVVDIDDPAFKNAMLDNIEKMAEPPIATTPRGGRHQWFLRPSHEIRNATNILPKVDFRGDGGYVLVPPSSNGNGKSYVWSKSIFDTDMTVLPSEVIKLIKTASYVSPEKDKVNQAPANCQQNVSMLTNANTCSQMLTEGRRDEDLFHIANCLAKGGAKDVVIQEIIKRLAMSCTPPFPVDEAFRKIESVVNRTERKQKTMTEEIRQWCVMQDGFFLLSELCSSLGLGTRVDKGAAYTAMGRLVKEGVIEKFGNKSGCYRKVDSEAELMDWEDAPTEDLDIDYPLGISGMVKTFPSNVIVFAGTSNSGKTTMLLDIARRNAPKFNINYFNSEMGASELKMRLNMFQNCDKKLWKRVRFFERSDNFDDVIKPDDINIIDYLEVLDDFWKVGQQIKAIHSKLNQGIAIIAIQKNKGAELGRGGALGTEKPRLYINMEFGKAKIIKAKNWRGEENPNGKAIDFQIHHGWDIIPRSDWEAV